MTQESQNEQNKPCKPDNWDQHNANNSDDETYRYSHIENKAEIEINNFKTCLFFYLREFLMLEKVINNHEDDTESSS